MRITPKIIEIANSVDEIGITATAEKYNLSIETVSRYRRAVANADNEETLKDRYIQDILRIYSKKELQALARGTYRPQRKQKIKSQGKEYRIGVITDTHIGSVYFVEEWLLYAFEVFEREKCDLILHLGDVTEGMDASRPHHIYTLHKVGYNAQRDYAVDLFNRTKIPIKMIAGNHDEWYLKTNGANIVEDIAKACPHVDFLGFHEADIVINKTTIKLWHGRDGAAKTLSLRPQNIIDTLPTKPDIMLLGHDHKRIYFKYYNTHVLAGGALCKQSDYMRYKKLINTCGFTVLYLELNNGVTKMHPCFYDFD